jgi:gliding motility-associated-like protein
MKKLITLALLLCAFGPLVHAQGVNLTIDQYEEMKLAGTLPAEYHVAYSTLPQAPVQHPSASYLAKRGGGGTGGTCNCWIEPDDTYSLALAANDDGSSTLINLPFSFNLYGESYTTLYINNNGNVSFQTSYTTFSASGFPSTQFKMVAPFWADVDTRFGQGQVQYKLTPNALYVNWVSVGYYSQGIAMPASNSLYDSFQLILSDGTNTDVGIGNTVSFCYQDMQWTTGTASFGVNGFGGTPATVGANRGNGVDYIQFGKFDHAGTDYLGPQVGTSQTQPPYSGVSWLDNKSFIFTTAVSTTNIPPIASSTSLCDTVEVCVNELVDLDVNFLSPEPDQLTTASYTISPPLGATVTETNSGPLNTANLHLQFIPIQADEGIHTITYTATDNGVPPLTTTVTVILHVFYTPAPPPLITGDTLACPGLGTVLTASGGYENYDWSNGYNGETVLVGPGTYYVQASTGACILVSNYVTVTSAIPPTPVITGVLFNCGGEPAHLTTSEPYSGYHWSNGSTDPSIDVSTGSYSVIVTDDHGCTGHADTVDVVSVNSPTAMFMGNPNGPVTPGTTVIYTDQSDGNGSNIVSWAWTVDSAGAGAGSTYASTFIIPGTYAVTLTVTNANGCTNTYTYSQVVVPTDIIAPNVFSPNSDGVNDALVFEGAQYYPNTALSVFNRWGQEVYSSGNYKNTWKGTDMPDGTYFYVLKLETGKEYSGNVTLLR